MKKDRLLTLLIIIISAAGIIYFGFRAVSENRRTSSENPFEYRLPAAGGGESPGHLKKGLLRCVETGQVNINLANVHGIALGPADRIYVSGDDSVIVLDKTGGIISSMETKGTARCLAVDEKGDVYLGMTDHIEVYDSKGKKKAVWESLGERALITSIALSPQAVFAADAGNRIVLKYEKSGGEPVRIGEKNEAGDIPGFMIPSPYFDVAIDAGGFLWAVNPGRHSLENYTPTGGFRSSWGEYSPDMEGFCGCCNPVHIAILADGSFVTAEKGMVRIKIYNRLGKLISLVAGPDRFAEGTVVSDMAVDSSGRIHVLDPAKKMVRVFSIVK